MPLRPSLEPLGTGKDFRQPITPMASAPAPQCWSPLSRILGGRRGRAEIRCLHGGCYYLNFQLAGDCACNPENGTGILLLPAMSALFHMLPKLSACNHDSFPEVEGRLTGMLPQA